MCHDQHHDHRGNPDDLQRAIARPDDPGRDEWQQPDLVLSALGLTQESVVCEIGAGTGYFALRLAKLASWVYAVDVETHLLSWLRDRAATAGVQNLTPVLGLPMDPLIPPNTCDLALAVNTFHRVPDKGAYLRRLRSALRRGGRVAIIDFHKRDLPVSPPTEHKLDREECLDHIGSAGMRVRSDIETLPYQYFFVLGD
jgi:ubiquinone/menaquinone biosynthesis C-methylase UbiE